YPNLVTVCNDCHHDIHEHRYQVKTDPQTGKHNITPPPEPFPDTGTTNWRPNPANPVLLN
ncbi:MAG: hypothetical protein OXF04_08900, partial [bacterium]|nr:hypothetical protein [bacterium]